MLKVTRYINGKKVDAKDIKYYILDNETILRTIKSVNERLAESYAT